MPDAYRRAIQAIRNLFPGRQGSVGINPVQGYGSLSLDGSVNMIIRPDRNTGVAVITLMRQEEHHREMMDDKALTPMDVNIMIEQIPERKEDG